MCETLWYRPDSYFLPDWRGNWAGEGGGPTLGHGIHQIDLLLHLMGPWETVDGHVRPGSLVRWSSRTCRWPWSRSSNGAVATVVTSLLSPRELSRIRVDTTAGTLEVNHVYGYSDADWSLDAGAATRRRRPSLGRDPGSRAPTGALRDSTPEARPVRRRLGRLRRHRTCPATTPPRSTRLVDDLLAGRATRPRWPAPGRRWSSSPRCMPPRCSARRTVRGGIWRLATRFYADLTGGLAADDDHRTD